MDIREKHLINEKTVLLTGEYNDRGELWSRIIEGEETFLVRKSPNTVIEETLLHVGSNFLGARRSAKFLLSPTRMHPISVNPQMGILLFPTKSLKCHCNIWFSLIHVKNANPVGINQIEVLTSFGHTILIDMSERTFNNKRQKAIQLQEAIIHNLNCPLNFYVEPKKGFYISKNPKENNYFIEKK
ncbi:competence protein ComK [Neobacillus sp. DY30]|uniref:competence protein ComK n=1 Tax=Neobacillus sp. DY30 TaxID=3047871 RepID=UPI0024C01028|nr:competence protein ComK [Neobacillus sp. DY30]WHY03531.1 competence protein ComK [Neobacillus sp. DY30]